MLTKTGKPGLLSNAHEMPQDAQSGLPSAIHTQDSIQIHPQPESSLPGVEMNPMNMAIPPHPTLGPVVGQDHRPQSFQWLVFATCKTEGATRWTDPTIHRLSACKSGRFVTITLYKLPEMSPVFTASGSEIIVIPVGPNSRQEYQFKFRSTAEPPERYTVWSWSFLDHDSSDFNSLLADPGGATIMDHKSAKIITKREVNPSIALGISDVQSEDRGIGDPPSDSHQVEHASRLLQSENVRPSSPQTILLIGSPHRQISHTSSMVTKRHVEVAGDLALVVKKARLMPASETKPHTNTKVLTPLSMVPFSLHSAKRVFKGQVIKTEAEYFTVEVFQTTKSGPGVILRSGPLGDIIINVLASKVSYKIFYPNSVEFYVDTRFSGSQVTEYWNFQLREQDYEAFRALVESAKESAAVGNSYGR